jgi:peptidoglycan/LPS O-acetylase OafA/YrhL
MTASQTTERTQSSLGSDNPGRTNAYRPDIDGLRAVAVLSVIAYHLQPDRIPGGFVGVDVFFVISGFLISSIIYDEVESNRFSLVRFYIRRIRRLYPALFLMLAASMWAGWLILLPSDFVTFAKQVIGGCTFVANFVLWRQSGYFSPDAALKPLLHLWSLGVEEQYYFIFPLICSLLYRKGSSWKLGAAYLLLSSISMFLNVWLVHHDSAAAFFLPFSRIWELFMGAALALLSKQNRKGSLSRFAKDYWRTLGGIIGLGTILFAAAILDSTRPFPGWAALLPTMGALLLIAVGPNSWINRRVLSLKPIVFIGLISYPVYLWHWPILSFLRIAQHTWGINLPVHFKVLLVLGGTFALSYATYRFAEQPVRRQEDDASRRKGALLLLGSVLACGAVGALIIRENGFPNRYSRAIAALDHNYAVDGSNAWREGTCFLRPDQLAGSFGKECIDGPDPLRHAKLVLVWGDSHAADLFPGLRALQKQGVNMRLAQFTASLCAPIEGLELRTRPACREINEAVLQQIRSIKPDIVILSAFWNYSELREAPNDNMEKLVGTIHDLQSSGVNRVVLIGSAPMWTNDVPVLLISQVRKHPADSLPYRLQRNFVDRNDDSSLQFVARRAGAVYIPLFDKLCDPVGCIATTGPSMQNFRASGITLRQWPGKPEFPSRTSR